MKVLYSDYCPVSEGMKDFSYFKWFHDDLIGRLRDFGHEVVWLKTHNDHESLRSVDEIESDTDVVFAIYRWSMPERPERDKSYIVQNRMLEQAKSLKIPVLLFDTDHQLPAKDNTWSHCVVASPELDPRANVLQLMFPWHQFSHPDRFTVRSGSIYVGNDYERSGSINRYLRDVSTTFIGTWTNESWKRLMESQGHSFRGKMLLVDALKEMQQHKFTVAFAKQSYYDQAVVTSRWQEALCAGVLVLIPDEFMIVPPQLEQFVVRSNKDVRDWLFDGPSGNAHMKMVSQQTEFVKSLLCSTFDYYVSLLQSISR